MKKNLFIMILCISIFTSFSCNNSKTRVIAVSGSGEVTYLPDMVTMTVTVKKVNPTLQESVDQTKESISEIMKVCKDYAIPDIDIKTSFAQTGKEYTWENNKQVFAGYKAEQTTEIILRDLTKFEEFTGKILAAKVHSLGSFKFGHSKKSEYESEAKLLALDDAKIAAEKMAERMNVKLGKVIYISDDAASFSYSYGYADEYEARSYSKNMAASSGFSVSPGLLKAQKGVTVTFEIK